MSVYIQGKNYWSEQIPQAIDTQACFSLSVRFGWKGIELFSQSKSKEITYVSTFCFRLKNNPWGQN